jgi:TolB protein
VAATLLLWAVAGALAAPAAAPAPPGGRIAFATGAGAGFDVWTMDADGGNRRDLTRNPAHDAEPEWSPDGRRILFTSYRTGRAQLYVMNANGSGLRRLVRLRGHAFEPAWSPDGSRIAYVASPDGRRDYRIWVMRADGTHRRRLSHAFDWLPSWSSGGRRIAFTSARSGPPSIYVMNADGSGQRRLLGTVGEDNEAPAWSPDGRMIAWIHQARLWLMNADVTGLRPLTPPHVSGVYDDRPEWSPDGSRIVFQTSRPPGGIAIVSRDGSGLTYLGTPLRSSDPSWQPRR